MKVSWQYLSGDSWRKKILSDCNYCFENQKPFPWSTVRDHRYYRLQQQLPARPSPRALYSPWLVRCVSSSWFFDTPLLEVLFVVCLDRSRYGSWLGLITLSTTTRSSREFMETLPTPAEQSPKTLAETYRFAWRLSSLLLVAGCQKSAIRTYLSVYGVQS